MKLIKLFILFFGPVIFIWFIYIKLSPAVCFSPANTTPAEVEKFILDNLNLEYKKIQILDPLIQFGNDWFKYDVAIENKFKVAFVIDESNFYSEATGTIMITTQSGSSTIPFESKAQIAKGISAEHIPNLIKDFSFFTESNMQIVSPPNTQLKVQTNTSWPICIFISLQKIYLPLVYFVCLVFAVGVLVLFREISTFINKGLKEYFIK